MDHRIRNRGGFLYNPTWRYRSAAYDLGDDEGGAEEEAGHLGEAPAAGARHEDERLADDAHLQVQRRHHLVPAAVQRPHAERVLSPEQTRFTLLLIPQLLVLYGEEICEK